MTRDKARKIALRIMVTFVEAAVAYLSVTGFNLSNKTAIAGAIGAGLSAAYNLAKHYFIDGSQS